MGTNFYWIDTAPVRAAHGIVDEDVSYDQQQQHIGKRSAAGKYCGECNLTLCKDGEKAIHSGKSEWYTSCPSCGRKVETTTCTFLWAVSPWDVRHICLSNPDEVLIIDEYGRGYTGHEFTVVLQGCAFHNTECIGENFS